MKKNNVMKQYISLCLLFLLTMFLYSGQTFAQEDDTPPTLVSVTGDTNGTTGETIMLTAVFEDNVGVTEIIFHIGTAAELASLPQEVVAAGVQSKGTMYFPIPSNSIDPIPYYVEAFDAAGNSARAPSEGTYTITVTDNDAPTVKVTQPNGGETVGIGFPYNILWTATDNIGVTTISLFYSTDDGASWHQIAAGEANDGTYQWMVPEVISSNCKVKVVAFDAAGNQSEDASDAAFTIKWLQVAYPFYDDFESGLAYWKVDAPWGITTEDAHGGAHALTDSPDDVYGNSIDISAQININLSNAKRPMLSFWEKYSLAPVDLLYVQISTNNGASWETVSMRGNKAPLQGTLDTWTLRRLDLTRHAKKAQVLIRFRLKTDNANTTYGWYIDDVSIDENTEKFVIPFFDDMESANSDNNWTCSSNDENIVWSRIQQDSDYAWHESPFGIYSRTCGSSLLLNGMIDLSAATNPKLAFRHKYYLSTYDEVGVYISGDGGQYFGKLVSWREGSQSNFTLVKIDLPASVRTPNVVIAFSLNASDDPWSGWDESDGWYIDDVAIYDDPMENLLHKPTNVTQHSLDISWDASANPNFLRYELYQSNVADFDWTNGALVASTTETQCHDEGLKSGQTYYYRLYVVTKPGELYYYGGDVVSATTPVYAYPFFDDFEDGASDWDLSAPWDVTTEAAHSGLVALTDSPYARYQNSVDVSASIGLDFSQARRPMLTFWEKYQLSPTAPGDFLYVLISQDNEVSWETISYRGSAPPLVGTTNGGWVERRIDLARYAYKPQVRIRFRLASDAASIDDGWYIDDVRVDENTQVFTVPFFDDMESSDSDNNWASTSNSASTVWSRIAAGKSHSGSYAWHDSPYGNYGNNVDAWLRLNGIIDLSNVANPRLSFWHRYSIQTSSYARVMVSGDGGQTFQELAKYQGSQDTFACVSPIDLKAYARNPNVVVTFLLDTGGYSSDGWYIDDVAIYDDPMENLLHKPTNVTQHSLDISWDASANPHFLRYELYRSNIVDFDWRSGTLVASTTETQYHDEGLKSGQTYYYRLYVITGPGELYNRGGDVISATTLAYNYPFFDDFEDGPSDWDLNEPWGVTTETGHSGSVSLTDSPYAMYQNNVNISASIGLDLSQARRPMLTFWEKYQLSPTAPGDFLYIEVSKDNEATWEVISYRGSATPLVGTTNGVWVERRIDLTRYAWKPQVRIRFHLASDAASIDDGWYIDDVRVDENTQVFTTPFFDDMESADSDNNWASTSNSTNTVWSRIAVGKSHSGSYAWHDSPYGNNGANVDAWLRMNGIIDLSNVANPCLSFWHRYSSHPSLSDYARVMVSGDGGQTFQEMAKYRGSQDTFTQVPIDLKAYARNPNVVVAFLMDTSGGGYDGWYIDDVYIGEAQESLINKAFLDSPATTSTRVDIKTEPIYGSVYLPGVTDAPGQGANIIAQLGYGAEGSFPGDNWQWVEAIYNTDIDDKDQYVATLTIDTPGRYDYAYRFKKHGTTIWTYADLDGNDIGNGGSNGYTIEQAGHLVVKSLESPPGDANGDGQVNVLDITKLERILVGLDTIPLGANPDCNGDGNVDILDITAIERVIVGLPPTAASPSPGLSPQGRGEYAAQVIRLSAVPIIIDKETFILTLSVDSVDRLDTAFFRLNCDPNALEIVNISPGLLTKKIMPTIHVDNSTGSAAAFFNAPGIEGISGSGSIAEITFKLLGETPPGSLLTISKTNLGDTSAKMLNVHPAEFQIMVPEIPRQTALLQNFPNPFNPETWIPFKLAAPSDVRICIYDVSGHLIRTIELNHKGIGVYTTKDSAARWDGCNERGERVSSGVYFYSLETLNFSAVKRLVILK